MNHIMPMQVIGGFAYLLKNCHPLSDRETVLRAEPVDGQSVNVIGDEIGEAVGCRTAIDDPRYMDMVQKRQDTSFPSKAFDQGGPKYGPG